MQWSCMIPGGPIKCLDDHCHVDPTESLKLELCSEQEEEHGDEQEKEGVLHEETFHRNPSLKLPEHPSRLQMAERTASHIWHRLPLLQV